MLRLIIFIIITITHRTISYSAVSNTLRNSGAYDWATYGNDVYRTSLNPLETSLTSQTAVGLTRMWKFNAGSSIVSQPVVAVDYAMPGNVIMNVAYFGDGNGKFYGMNTKDGSIQWKRQFESYNYISCGDMPQWGIIGAATFDRKSYCFNYIIPNFSCNKLQHFRNYRYCLRNGG